ncbi:MAG: hypothetical protein RL156_1403 [Bacteroidota bacterium]
MVTIEKATATTTTMLARSKAEIRTVKTMVTEKGVAKKFNNCKAEHCEFQRLPLNLGQNHLLALVLGKNNAN